MADLPYRRFPNRQSVCQRVELIEHHAGLETRDTADLEVCATKRRYDFPPYALRHFQSSGRAHSPAVTGLFLMWRGILAFSSSLRIQWS